MMTLIIAFFFVALNVSRSILFSQKKIVGGNMIGMDVIPSQ